MSDESTRAADQAASQRANATAFVREMVRKISYGGRTVISVILAILAVTGLVLSTSAFWARSIIFEEDEWIRTVRELPRDHEVAVALGQFLTNELFVAVDFEERIENALPDDVAVIVPILTNAIEGFVADKVTEFIESDQFETIWITANREAHRLLIGLLDEQSTIPGLETTDDEIVLNLLPAIGALLSEIGGSAGGIVGVDLDLPDLDDPDVQESIRDFGEQLGVDLPDDFGQITVYQGDKLPQARETVVLVERIRFVTAVLTVVFFAGALWISPSRRRMMVGLLIGSAIGFFLLLEVPNGVGSAVADLVTDETDQVAARHAIDMVFDSYVTLYRWMLFTAVFAALMLLVTGTSRPALWVRREIRQQVERFDWATPVGDFLQRNLRWLRIGGPAFMFFLLLVVARGELTSLFLFVAFLAAWESLLGLLPNHPRNRKREQTAPTSQA